MSVNHMIRFRTALAFCVALCGAATTAHAGEAHGFVRDGVTYSYTSKTYGDSQVLAGTADDKAFRLVVRNGHVRGEFNGKPVHFPVALVRTDASLALK